MRRVLRVLVIAVTAATACVRSGNSSGSSTSEFEARAGAIQHPINGKVLKFDKGKHTVTLSHDAIPNFMEAMTMDFRLKEGWPFGVMGD